MRVPPVTSFFSLALVAAITFLIGVNDTLAIDLDGDQMSDVWEMVFGAQSLAASADTDGDGFTNLPLVLPNIGNFYDTAGGAAPVGFMM